MEKKKITVYDVEYEFFFDENLKMWRILEISHLVKGHVIDIEINLENFTENLNWNQVIKFIELFYHNNSIIVQRIKDAKEVLLSLFKSINRDIYDIEFMNFIEFHLSGIDYKGNCKNINMEKYSEYDYFFFPQYTKDPNLDIGSFVWRANFRDKLLLGVYCDRI